MLSNMLPLYCAAVGKIWVERGAAERNLLTAVNYDINWYSNAIEHPVNFLGESPPMLGTAFDDADIISGFTFLPPKTDKYNGRFSSQVPEVAT